MSMRIGSGRLVEKRAARSSRILVTGAAGFLGSHMAVALLEAGFQVAVLVRSSKTLTARDRVARLAAWFGLDERTAAAIEVVEGDILDPGWPAAMLAGAAGPEPFDEIVHCASNTAFAERKRAEVEAANIDGLRNVLDYAVRGGCAFFHHVSTAYVAGRCTGPCREDWVEQGPFTNVYEETKARGEIMARDICRAEGLRLNVYRPTIVYGNSRTGRTLRFNALYFPVKAAVFLRDIYLADIRQGDGRRAAELGIRLTEGGALVMPIRIDAGRGGGINLVPVDHCVRAFMAIFEDGLDGGIYHISNPRVTTLEELVAFGKRRFQMEGIEACGPESFDARPRNTLEVLYDSYLEIYRPYMQDTRVFDISNAAPFLEKRGLVCPVFDYEIFSRCMDYAVEAEWGARLFAR
jgi:nucleoside-diphosphate-sugar epimerase